MRMRRIVGSNGLVVAGLVLAVSVALSGAIASLMWRLFVDPLAVERPERLVVLRTIERDGDIDESFSPLQYEVLKQRGAMSGLQGTASIGYQNVDIGTERGRVRATAAYVSADFFQVMGTPIRRGRGLLRGDFDVTARPVAVLSDYSWRRYWSSRADIVGRSIEIGGDEILVVGVAPPEQRGARVDVAPAVFLPTPLVRPTLPHRPELWAAMFAPSSPQSLVSIGWLNIIARLRDGDSLRGAERRLSEEVARQGGPSFDAASALTLLPLLEAAVPTTSRLDLLGTVRLFTIVSVALLVLGATVLALVGLRDLEAKRTEVVTRLALGATLRGVMMTVTGPVPIIGACAVVLALPLAWLMLRAVGEMTLPGDVNVAALGLDLSRAGAATIVAAGSVAVTLATAVVFLGLVGYARRWGSAGTVRPTEARLVAPRLRRAVVATLMSLAIALLGGAVFAFQAASRSMAVDVGHDADRLVYASFNLRENGYSEEAAQQLMAEVTRRGLGSPVIKRITAQFRAGGFVDTLYVDGQKQDYKGNFPMLAVDRFYFDVLGLGLVAGRGFGTEDRAGAEPAVVVSAAVARDIAEHNGLDDASRVVGRQLLLGPPYGTAPIVGVVDDWISDPRDLSGRALYILADQHPMPPEVAAAGLTGFLTRPTLLMDTEDVPEAKQVILAALRDLDPKVSPSNLSSTRERLESAFAIQHLAGRVMSVFSVVAVCLVFVSLHVLIRSVAAAKRGEIAIRVALGASRLGMARWFTGEIARPLVAAFVIGSAALWLWFNVMSAHVVGIHVGDLTTVLVVLGCTCLSALVAAIGSAVVVASRAPADVLRQQ